jgi:hypothetical protein
VANRERALPREHFEALALGGMDVRRDASARIDPRLDDEHVAGGMMELVALAQNGILDHT